MRRDPPIVHVLDQGTMRKNTDPRFQSPQFAEYRNATSKLDALLGKTLASAKFISLLAGSWINSVLASPLGEHAVRISLSP
jgi:hypothetical protein